MGLCKRKRTHSVHGNQISTIVFTNYNDKLKLGYIYPRGITIITVTVECDLPQERLLKLKKDIDSDIFSSAN